MTFFYSLWKYGLNILHTIGNCQRPVFSLGVAQHMHQITNLWTFQLNWSSKLRDNNERKTPLSHKLYAFRCLISRPRDFWEWQSYIEKNCLGILWGFFSKRGCHNFIPLHIIKNVLSPTLNEMSSQLMMMLYFVLTKGPCNCHDRLVVKTWTVQQVPTIALWRITTHAQNVEKSDGKYATSVWC